MSDAEFKKKSTFDKVVVEDEDLTELPDEIKYLSQELDEEIRTVVEGDDEEDEDEEEDADLNPTEWARKFEREVAEWDQEERGHDEEDVGHASEATVVEDDRLYVEMPGYDASPSLAESQIGVNEDANVPDPFQHWDQGMA